MSPLKALLAATVLLAPAIAHAAALEGRCGFDRVSLSFSGSATEQAACLLRTVHPGGAVDASPATLPPALATRIGQPFDLPRAAVAAALKRAGLTALAEKMDAPLSRGNDNAADAPLARYLVIHDTSTPYLADAPFPADIDTGDAVNDLSRFAGENAVTHVFINRRGEVLVGHDLSVPWRATKLESKVIGLPAKGLFLHIENIQPRRASPDGKPGNDIIAPVPGLTNAQYRTLALLYIGASARGGTWLIPAFHAAIDEGLADAHDDPQNFDLLRFAEMLDQALASVKPVP